MLECQKSVKHFNLNKVKFFFINFYYSFSFRFIVIFAKFIPFTIFHFTVTNCVYIFNFQFLPPFEFKFNVNIESVNIPEGADPLNIVFMSQIYCVDRPENQFYFDSKPGYMRMDITFLDQICPGGKYQLKVQMTEPSKTQPKTLEILVKIKI